MSTLPIRTSQIPQIGAFSGLSRVGAFFVLMAEVLAEAHRSMREANRKYPFAGV